ncbi:MAG: hypothetical protein K8R36_20930 [Planctomycetales bacterium]|nr:hypothetical protein [Planctomycetales bacterium]
MNNSSHSYSNGHAAIAAVLSFPVPMESLQQMGGTWASWEAAAAISLPRLLRRWSMASAATAAIGIVVVSGILLQFSGPDEKLNEANAEKEVAAEKEVKGDPKKPAPQAFHEPVPMTGAVFAEAAPIVACIGPEKPIKLGAVVSHADINKGLDANVVRLHIWDWSKSDVSRVMLIQRSELGVLSPDGTTMLTPEGETLSLESHETRQFSGFQVKDGQRMSAVKFSPSRKHAAAMIHVRTQIDKVPGNPALSGATHFWSLRLLELNSATNTGKRIGEFPAQAHAGAAFAPDEASVVHSSEDHGIIRRDLASGKVLNEYQPSLGVHGAVGIAISPDGRFIAAGQYHGKIFIWEMQSGKLLVDHQFLRDNGEQDTFFQAKVLRFSPNGERLAMASGNRLKVMETKTGKIIKQHYHETTPVVAHLQWSPDAKNIILATYSEPTEYAGKERFPPRPTADLLPRVYEWDWQAGEPRLKWGN